MLYGWFFYPLFRLGEEQLYRVMESAAKACYHQVGGRSRRPDFAEAVRYLVGRRVIRSDEQQQWDAARQLRNIGSHPEQRTVMTPGQTLKSLGRVAHDINLLFLRARRVVGSAEGAAADS
jgi:hypothetical protein